MSTEQAEEALKDFFESALTPDDETRETDDSAGIVQGLKVTLMKHQTEGLRFLHDHESKDDKVKGKGNYGGILADDASLSFFVTDDRWVSARQFKL
jgi:SNF2 family DNA or RNA helicase